ncbi:hypothetical protein Fmac_011505 [Flemingia macrophylla]|uniref:Uncharacterized protein n=1 Tax=Flemingia macrophylla TaxID=520843 RepID=A0ABD1MMN7_9FABA
MSSIESSSSSSESSDADTLGSNSVFSTTPSSIWSPKDVEWLAEALEQDFSGEGIDSVMVAEVKAIEHAKTMAKVMERAKAQANYEAATIHEHVSTSSGGIPDAFVGSGFLHLRVTAQEFMSAEARVVVDDMFSAETLKAFEEIYLRCVALAEYEKVTNEILACNNELIEANKKASTDNVALHGRVEKVIAKNNKLVEGRDKATLELSRLDKEFKCYMTWAQVEAARHHEHGFNHVVQQAKSFCDLKGHDFDIGMDFHKAKYMSYDDMPKDAKLDEDVEPLYVEVHQQVKGGDVEEETQAEET